MIKKLRGEMKKVLKEISIVFLISGMVGGYLFFNSGSVIGDGGRLEMPVQEFEGYQDYITETFSIDRDEWQFRWNVVPEGGEFYFSIGVFREGESEPCLPVVKVTTGGEESSAFSIHEGSDIFILCISTDGIQRWEIEVVQFE